LLPFLPWGFFFGCPFGAGFVSASMGFLGGSATLAGVLFGMGINNQRTSDD
jgi:hypothetical protein